MLCDVHHKKPHPKLCAILDNNQLVYHTDSHTVSAVSRQLEVLMGPFATDNGAKISVC